MRHRSEILNDAIRNTDKDVTVPEFSDKLRLLTLEVLVDIRDALNTEPSAEHTLSIIKELIH